MTHPGKTNLFKYMPARRRWYQKHRERLILKARANWLANVDARRAQKRKHYQLNRKKILAKTKRWAKKNRVTLNERTKSYLRKRRSEDPIFRLYQCLRLRLYHAVRGHCKSARTLELLGCSIQALWDYLESQFQPGMTRENYGKVWQVDHKVPCASFDLAKPEHQRRCFHFTNLQPLFKEQNWSKNDTTTGQLYLI